LPPFAHAGVFLTMIATLMPCARACTTASSSAAGPF
jgi:hypothetical protein